MDTHMTLLRTKLRAVNIEHSALLRRKAGEDWFVRLAELRNERRALMALIAANASAPKVRAPRHNSSGALHSA